MGCVSPLAANVTKTWEAILKGKSGARVIDKFDTSDLSSKIICPVVDYDPSDLVDVKDIRRNDPFIVDGLHAAHQAISHANLVATEENSHKIGSIIGSGIGGLSSIEACRDHIVANDIRKISPFWVPGCLINMVSGNVSIKHNFRGPNFAIVSACASGTHSIGNAMRLIRYGDADCMVVGGAENVYRKTVVAGFGNAKALSKRNDNPQAASRPFDSNRDGFVVGCGSAVMVIESLEFARARGATILAELAGYGASSDAYHVTQPRSDGLGPINCMKMALRDAQINPEQIDYINAHGTSTPAGDKTEANAINAIFPKKVPVSSTKSMIGHLLGAAGSMEAIFSVLAVRDNVMPPTINIENQDPECDINCIKTTPLEAQCNYALSNSFGFGGTNGTLIFKKFED